MTQRNFPSIIAIIALAKLSSTCFLLLSTMEWHTYGVGLFWFRPQARNLLQPSCIIGMLWGEMVNGWGSGGRQPSRCPHVSELCCVPNFPIMLPLPSSPLLVLTMSPSALEGPLPFIKPWGHLENTSDKVCLAPLLEKRLVLEEGS